MVWESSRTPGTSQTLGRGSFCHISVQDYCLEWTQAWEEGWRGAGWWCSPVPVVSEGGSPWSLQMDPWLCEMWGDPISSLQSSLRVSGGHFFFCWNFSFSALPQAEGMCQVTPVAMTPSGPGPGVVPWVGFKNRTNIWAGLGVSGAPQRLEVKLRLLWTVSWMIFLA